MVYRTAPIEAGANPLVNDDQYLNSSAPIEFGSSPAGLDLRNEPMPPAGLEVPRIGQPGWDSGPGVERLMNAAGPGLQPMAPVQGPQASMFYSPSTGEMVVNGYQFNERNASNALESESWASQPPRQFQLPDTADDWREMAPEEYASYIASIRSPSVGRRASEAWEHAWRGFGDVNLGAALAVNPNWEWAQQARENLTREFHENAPFMVGLRDIENVDDAATFAMQMSIQAVPWVVETIAAMTVGAVAGGIVSGGVGAPAGAVEGLIAREGLRRATTAVLSQRLRAGATAYSRILGETGASQLGRQQMLRAARPDEVEDLNRFWDFSERLFHLSRGSADDHMLTSWGARLGAAGSNYSAAVGDIRNSIADAGGDPTSANSIANIWGGAIPYALMETFGDIIWTAPLTRTFPEFFDNAAGLAGRATRGGVVGVSEGLQEMGQFGITQAATANATGTDLDIDPIDLLEQGAGGFFAGGAVGAVLGGRTAPADPGTVLPTTPSAPVPTGPQPDPFFEVDPEGEDPFTGILPYEQPMPEGMGTGYMPEPPVPSQPPAAPAAEPFEMPEYPGQVDMPEQLIPGSPSVARPSGWPPPAPPNLSDAPPELIRQRADVAQQRQNEDRSVNNALIALSNFNPRMRRAFNEVLKSVQDNLFINTTVLQDVQRIPELVVPPAGRNATDAVFPQEHAAMALMIPEQTKALVVEHNRKMLDELQGLYQDARSLPSWPVEKLERYRALAKSVTLKGGQILKPAERTSIMDVQQLVVQALRNRQTTPKAPKITLGKTENRQARIAELEEKLAEIDAELKNPVGTLKNRKTLERRATRLREELGNLRDKIEGGKRQGDIRYTPVKGEQTSEPEVKPSAPEETKPVRAPTKLEPFRTHMKKKAEERKEQTEEPVSENPPTDRIKEAARRAKEANETPQPKAEPKSTLNENRVELGYKQLVKSSEEAKINAAQRIRGYLTALKKGNNVSPRTREWAEVNGVLLTQEEALAVEAMFPPRQTKTPRTKTTGGLSKADREARRFAIDVLDEFKNSKDIATGTPEMFATWVNERAQAAQGWLNTPEKPGEAAARSAVKKILRDAPKQEAAIDNRQLRQQKLWELIQKVELRIPSSLNKRKTPYFPTMWREEIAAMPNSPFRNVKEVTETFKALTESLTEAGEAARAYEYTKPWLSNKAKDMANSEYGGLPLDNSNVIPFKKPVKAVPADPSNNTNELSFEETKKAVNAVQKRIIPRGRFRTVHVFTNPQQLIEKRHEHSFIASNGAEVTIERWLLGVAERMKLENQYLKTLPYEDLLHIIRDGQLDFRGAVIPGFDALIVFSDSMKSERELMEVLEHEYIVHKGLRAIFPNDADREAFLQRVFLIPGFQGRLDALLHRYPQYGQYTLFEQVEEVLAFHSMEGPLALEQLLSAKEAINPETRLTLWQELKKIVSGWLEAFFGSSRRSEDRAMDDVIAGLREYALTGSTGGLNDSLLWFKGLKVDPTLVDRIKVGMRSEIIMAADDSKPLTQEEYNQLTYGYDDTAGQPYTPERWLTTMEKTLQSADDTLTKLHELARKAGGTTVKEKLRAAGRLVEPMNNMAQRSTLIEKLMEMMHRTIGGARERITKRQETRIYASKSKIADKVNGSTQEEQNIYNRMAALATNSRLPKTSEQVIRANLGLVYRDEVTGVFVVNKEHKAKLIKKGYVTKQEFKDGLPIYTITPKGETVEQGKHKIPAADVDAVYDRIYIPETKHMAESAVDELEDAIYMLNQMNDEVVERLLNSNKFEGADATFAEEVLRRVHKLYSDISFHNSDKQTTDTTHKHIKRARSVMVELLRAFHTKEKVIDWTDSSRTAKNAKPGPRADDAFKWREITKPSDDVKPFVSQIGWFLEKDATTGKSRLERMHDVYTKQHGTEDNPQYEMLNAFQNAITTEMDVRQREKEVIQSILGHYVELTRRGKWRVYVEVLNKSDGKRANISPDFITSLPIVYPEDENQANILRANLEAKMHREGGYRIEDVDGNPITVVFNVKAGRAPGVRTLAEAPNVKQFLAVAQVINLKLTAKQMADIANLIENAGGRKRFGLKRAGIPGYDADIIKSNSEVMTRRAWVGAKMRHSWMMNSIFDDRKNLYGDEERLARLQLDFDMANRGAPEGQPAPTGFVRNEAAVYYTEKALLAYANQMKHMMERSTKQSHVVVRTTKGEVKLKIEPEAQVHLLEAQALREALKRNELELNLNDIISKTGPLRFATVVLTLGSIGSGIMQAFSLFTHLPVVLTAKHGKSGYGEGYSTADVMSGMMSALWHTGVKINMNDSKVVHEMLEAAKKGDTSSGMTVDELEFLYAQTLDGLLSPQQTYSMTGGTESSIPILWMRNLAELFMLPFAKIEAAVRRVAALMIYRLAKARRMRAGATESELLDPTSQAYKALKLDVQRPIFQSQGDYANINRSKILRGDIGQYFGMFKMFPIMTVAMLYNLPVKQQLAFLAILFLLGGLKGEPFADDFMDVYDTVLQKLGFQHDSVELQLVQMLEDIQPGLSTFVMNGFIDSAAFGGTMSTRISMGDIIPGTGMFRADADMYRELTGALGPAFGSNVAALEWAWLVTDFTMQTVGLKNRTNNWEDLVRTMPQAQIRALGEAGLMIRDGQIVDSRGRLVSDDVAPMAIFMRALGFYPIEATRANTAVRLDRMHLGYMRATRARYVLSYAAAFRDGDEQRMDRIADDVRRWNEAAEQTGQEDMMITNFRSAGRRAGQAASRTTVERASESAPDYSVIDEVAAALNADDESGDNDAD